MLKKSLKANPRPLRGNYEAGKWVSENNKWTNKLCREWQESVQEMLKHTSLVVEVAVFDISTLERFDILHENVAYELKASGNNPKHEFFKDLFKVICYNELREENRLKEFVFMTEQTGIDKLNKNQLVTKAKEIVPKTHGFEITLLAYDTPT